MVDLRRIVVIFIIAVLFSVLVFSTIDAIYPSPSWSDFCGEDDYAKPYYPSTKEVNCSEITVTDEDQQSCKDKNGRIEFENDKDGCPTSYECNTCHHELDMAREKHNMVMFIVSSILSLIAIGIALLLPMDEDLNEWIATGFMLGGLFTLFFGTAQYFGDMARWLRPVIILVELLIVIFLAYKKLSNKNKPTKAKPAAKKATVKKKAVKRKAVKKAVKKKATKKKKTAKKTKRRK